MGLPLRTIGLSNVGVAGMLLRRVRLKGGLGLTRRLRIGRLRRSSRCVVGQDRGNVSGLESMQVRKRGEGGANR